MHEVNKTNEELTEESSIPELSLMIMLVGANSAKDFMKGITKFIQNITDSDESVYQILYNFYKRNHTKED